MISQNLIQNDTFCDKCSYKMIQLHAKCLVLRSAHFLFITRFFIRKNLQFTNFTLCFYGWQDVFSLQFKCLQILSLIHVQTLQESTVRGRKTAIGLDHHRAIAMLRLRQVTLLRGYFFLHPSDISSKCFNLFHGSTQQKLLWLIYMVLALKILLASAPSIIHCTCWTSLELQI